MKIMLSEEGTIWNDSISILESYAEDVVVISYYIRRVLCGTDDLQILYGLMAKNMN